MEENMLYSFIVFDFTFVQLLLLYVFILVP